MAAEGCRSVGSEVFHLFEIFCITSRAFFVEGWNRLDEH